MVRLMVTLSARMIGWYCGCLVLRLVLWLSAWWPACQLEWLTGREAVCLVCWLVGELSAWMVRMVVEL